MGKKSNQVSLIFFILGLIGALGFRFILILNKINPILANFSWYIAIICYLFFYLYRYYITEKRREIIIRHKLRQKIMEDSLEFEDKQNLRRIIDSILVFKAKWNFLILFILTLLALILQIIVDLLLK